MRYEDYPIRFCLLDGHVSDLAGSNNHRRRFENFVAEAVAGEKHGYWGMYVTEHHFASDVSYRPYDLPEDVYPPTDSEICSDALMFLNYVAAKTSRIRLGTAIVVPHWDHPVRVAEKVAMLDCLSGGRVELGIGRGGGYREDVVFDIPPDPQDDMDKFVESVAVIQRALTGEPFSYDGRFFQVPAAPSISIVPRPIQQPVPLWIASTSDRTLTYSAKIGLPFQSVGWGVSDFSIFTERRERWTALAQEAGHDTDGLYFPVTAFMYCGENDEEAVETARDAIFQFHLAVEHHYEFARGKYRHKVTDGGHDLTARRLEAATAEAAMVDAPIAHHIIGGVDTCIERVKQWTDEYGVRMPLLLVGQGRMPIEKTLASIRRFATEVMPHFKDKVSAPASLR